MTAAKAYDSEANYAHLAGQGVVSGIIRRRPRSGRPRLYRRQRSKIESRFAEGKSRHGLAQARYWGVIKVILQVIMVALVTNLKSLVKLILEGAPPHWPAWAASDLLGRPEAFVNPVFWGDFSNGPLASNLFQDRRRLVLKINRVALHTHSLEH